MKTYKTVTVNNYFFGICRRVVDEYSRKLNIDFHNYVAEMHSRIIKNKSIYGFLSNDPIKNLEPRHFNEFRGKLWDCASVYYYSKLLDTGKEPTVEELNKMFWLEKRHIEMINEINNFKRTVIFEPEFQIMEVINSPH